MKQLYIYLFIFVGLSPAVSQETTKDLYQSALLKDSLKDYQGALVDLDKAIHLNKDNDTLHILHAKIEAENLHIKEAFTEINEVIKHNQQNYDAYLLRGTIKAKSGNYEGAVHDFTKCLKIFPGSPKAFYNRGLAHAYLDEFKAALADFSKTIELNPSYHNVWFQQGYWKELSGDYEGALADLQKAQELDPGNTEILIEIAVVYYRLKQNDKSCNILHEAKDKGSSSAEELTLLFCK